MINFEPAQVHHGGKFLPKWSVSLTSEKHVVLKNFFVCRRLGDRCGRESRGNLIRRTRSSRANVWQVIAMYLRVLYVIDSRSSVTKPDCWN